MTTRSKFNTHTWLPIGLLAISAALYAILLYVRTLQAWKWFGDSVDMYPLAANIRAITALAWASADQLRWISYLIFACIATLYGLALRASARAGGSERQSLHAQYAVWVVIPYIVLGIVSLVLYPHMSRPVDTIDYTMHGRVQLVYGQNPYIVPGGTYADADPIAQSMEAKQRPSVYGPVWQYLSLLPSVLGAGQVIPSIVAFKVLFFLAGLLCLWLVWLFHTHAGAANRQRLIGSGVLLSWNPVLHLISHGEGHNDIWMAVFLAGALVLLVFDRPALAFVSWCLSVLVKFISAPLAMALIAAVYMLHKSTHMAGKLKPIAVGLAISGLLVIAVALPFGVSGLLSSVSGRYGGLVSSSGDSKISVVAALLGRVLSVAGIHSSISTLASIVGLALPLAWLAYGLLRGLSAGSVARLVKIAVEIFLIYLTFVAIPLYAQYVVTPVVLAAFLVDARWHRLAVLVASIALVWDSLFLVYLPPAYPAWEGYLHQLSHVGVIIVGLIYLATRIHGLVKPGLSRTFANSSQ